MADLLAAVPGILIIDIGRPVPAFHLDMGRYPDLFPVAAVKGDLFKVPDRPPVIGGIGKFPHAVKGTGKACIPMVRSGRAPFSCRRQIRPVTEMVRMGRQTVFLKNLRVFDDGITEGSILLHPAGKGFKVEPAVTEITGREPGQFLPGRRYRPGSQIDPGLSFIIQALSAEAGQSRLPERTAVSPCRVKGRLKAHIEHGRVCQFLITQSHKTLQQQSADQDIDGNVGFRGSFAEKDRKFCFIQ